MRGETSHQMSYDESSSFVVFRPPLLRKTNTGGGYLRSPSGHCLGISGGGSQLVLCDGEAWGQLSLGGQGLRVARAREAAGPLVPMASQARGCFCLLPSSGAHGTHSAQTHTGKENRGQDGVAGGARWWLTTQACGKTCRRRCHKGQRLCEPQGAGKAPQKPCGANSTQFCCLCTWGWCGGRTGHPWSCSARG